MLICCVRVSEELAQPETPSPKLQAVLAVPYWQCKPLAILIKNLHGAPDESYIGFWLVAIGAIQSLLPANDKYGFVIRCAVLIEEGLVVAAEKVKLQTCGLPYCAASTVLVRKGACNSRRWWGHW